MSHKEMIEFCNNLANQFSDRFLNADVLDCGSLDINGNNRWMFSGGTYYGIDIGSGANVDETCLVHEFQPDCKYDVIISTEMLEHDQYYPGSLVNMVGLLRKGGMLILTCGTTGRGIHGTIGHSPGTSPTSQIPGWQHYYRNITIDDIRAVLDVDVVFSRYAFEINNISKDLYFWGITGDSD